MIGSTTTETVVKNTYILRTYYVRNPSILRGKSFTVVSETIVDIIECTHSIPKCTATARECP